MIIVDVAIVMLLLFAVYSGSRRGLLSVALEFIVLVLACSVALVGYRAIGNIIQFIGATSSQANVIAAISLGLIVEVLAGVGLIFWRRRRQTRIAGKAASTGTARQATIINRLMAGAINGIKVAAIVAAGVIVYDALPLPQQVKQPVVAATLPQALLQRSAAQQAQWADGLGADILTAFTTYVITADPESLQRIELGFTTTSGRVDAAQETEMLRLVNAERIKDGKTALQLNPEAQVVARAYAARMLSDGVFAHIDKDGHTPFQRLKAGSVRYGAAGENLALAPTLARAHTGLMRSPGHRANILSADYRRVGIGIVDAGSYGIMVVQNFTD